MLHLRSADRLVAELSRASRVEVYSYTLERGPVLAALEAAARRGARVRVRLEGTPFPDHAGALSKYNRGLADALRRCGADARLLHDGSDAGPPMHAKAIVADGRLFLDDRNFNSSDLIVGDDQSCDVAALRDAVAGKPADGKPALAFDKLGAVEREADLINSSRRGSDVIVVSETFGTGPVCTALDDFAKRGGSPRLVVSDRAARGNLKEARALGRLEADGVRVRVASDSEKFAVAGTRAWIGSANASSPFPRPKTVEWGGCTRSRSIVAELQSRSAALWQRARPFRARTALSRCGR